MLKYFYRLLPTEKLLKVQELKLVSPVFKCFAQHVYISLGRQKLPALIRVDIVNRISKRARLISNGIVRVAEVVSFI